MPDNANLRVVDLNKWKAGLSGKFSATQTNEVVNVLSAALVSEYLAKPRTQLEEQ